MEIGIPQNQLFDKYIFISLCHSSSEVRAAVFSNYKSSFHYRMKKKEHKWSISLTFRISSSPKLQKKESFWIFCTKSNYDESSVFHEATFEEFSLRKENILVIVDWDRLFGAGGILHKLRMEDWRTELVSLEKHFWKEVAFWTPCFWTSKYTPVDRNFKHFIILCILLIYSDC